MEMTPIVTIIIALTAVVGVFGGMTIAIPYLVKKGINISGILNGTSTALQAADYVTDTLEGFFPDVAAFALLDKVIGWAQKAAEAAEQLYKTSVIEAEQRKAEATKLVYEFIEAAGVEIDDNIKKIVDGAIEAAVFTLPETHAKEA